MLAVDLRQLPRSGKPPQLFAQFAPLLSAAEPQLAHQLLITRAPIGQPLDMPHQFAVVHGSMVRDKARPPGYGLQAPGYLLQAPGRLPAFWLQATGYWQLATGYRGSTDVHERATSSQKRRPRGCQFTPKVFNMQITAAIARIKA